MARIGIYAGTFNPVHAGHITFALQAVEAAELDELYFLPERQPRSKKGVEHFGHRVAMLRRAAAPHPKFEILELEDVNFSVKQTLPRLRKRFPGDQLVFLFGSDAISHLLDWPLIDRLLAGNELVIGVREEGSQEELKATISKWPVRPPVVTLFPSYAPAVSSGKIRSAMRRGRQTAGLLKSVERYSDQHWLYVSLSQTVDKP
ncbi:MAG: adenylyltransferase/cytidyltransferase family protein [Candidatus Saccharimonadales bacterium]